MVIKKIFEGISDEEIHSAFLKFGRGEYKNKYLLEAKKQAKNWNIKTGPEFVNFLVRKCLEKVSGPIEIKGVIVSTMDLTEEIPFEIKKVSNFQGVRKNVIDSEINPQEILELMERYPRVFFALSFKGNNFNLKVKAKAPTSGKPGKEDSDGPKIDFCNLKTEDSSIVRELLFDVGEFNQAKIIHEIIIEEIVYPSNLSELSPAEVREQAKRKGKVIRTAIIDEKEKVSEAEFVA